LLLRPRSDTVGVAVTRTPGRRLSGTHIRPPPRRRPLLLQPPSDTPGRRLTGTQTRLPPRRPRSDTVGVAVGRTRRRLSGTHVRPPPLRRGLLLPPRSDTVGVAVTRTAGRRLSGTGTRPTILRRRRRFYRRARGLRRYGSRRHRPPFGGWGIGRERLRGERCGGAGPFGGRRTAFGVSGRLGHLTEGRADSNQRDRQRGQRQQPERTDALVTFGLSFRRLQMPDGRFARDFGGRTTLETSLRTERRAGAARSSIPKQGPA
jgi:hypothetical protein